MAEQRPDEKSPLERWGLQRGPNQKQPRRFPEISTGTAKSVVLIGVGVASAIGVGYILYKLANPGAVGGPCTDPATPCGSAIQPYQQEFQVCVNQYTQLMSQIVQGGQAPTPGQLAQLQQLRDCMDTSANNIARVANQYKPTSLIDVIELLAAGALVIAFVKYGLPGIGSFYNSVKGRTVTTGTGGAGIAAVVFNTSIQYAVKNNLLSTTQISAWESAVKGFTTEDIAASDAFFSSLAAQALLTQFEATNLATEYNNAMLADADFTIAALTPLLGYSPMVAAPAAAGCGACY